MGIFTLDKTGFNKNHSSYKKINGINQAGRKSSYCGKDGYEKDCFNCINLRC